MIEAIRVCLQENEENFSDDIELELEDFLDLFSTDMPETQIFIY
jgi:hypothetical protein